MVYTTWGFETFFIKGCNRLLRRSERKIEAISLAAVLSVALLWRVLFFSAIQNTPLAFWHTWDQSDMHSFWQQARTLAAGDWLAHVPYHPYHNWMRVAPRAVWEPFFARPAFYQAPLYSYFLALLMRLKVDAALWARIIQLALGVGATGLVWGVTRRLFGRGAALGAGMLVAAYAPLLVIESQVLRDTLVLFLMLLIFYLYQGWTLQRPRRAGVARPLTLGVLLGVLTMAHEGVTLLGVAVLTMGLMRLRGQGREALRWVGLLALGLLIGYGPLLARNLAVGAPALPRFAGSAFAFAVANHASAPWGGATWIAPTTAFGQTLAQSQGNVGALVAGTLQSYHGEWWRWLGHWAMRLGALGLAAENNENVCQAYFNHHVPILAFCVDFRILLPLALTGAALWGRRRWRAALLRGSSASALALHGLLVVLMLSLVLPLGRYRLMLLPALAPWAGRGVFVAWAAFKEKRSARLGVAAGLLLILAAAQFGLGFALPFDRPYGGLRPVDYQLAARMYVDWGRPDLALGEFHNGIDAGLPSELFDLDLGIAAEAAGNELMAANYYQRTLAREPNNAIALLRLGWLRAAANNPQVRNLPEAETLARRCTPANRQAEVKDLLAAASAASGDYAKARELAEQALATARTRLSATLASKIEARLALYRQGRPYVRPGKTPALIR